MLPWLLLPPFFLKGVWEACNKVIHGLTKVEAAQKLRERVLHQTQVISKSTKTQQPISKRNKIGIGVPRQTKHCISSMMAVHNQPPNRNDKTPRGEHASNAAHIYALFSEMS
jgi:hypothetical protein